MGIGKIIKRLLLAALVVVVVLNWTWGRIPSQPDPPTGSKFVQVDGAKIFYKEKPGREPAVIMLHGLPGTHNDWNSVAMETGQRTIAIDRPGFGWTEGGYMPFDEQITAIHTLSEKLNLRRPVIAGHSYGGTLAIRYAKTYPRDVRGVVLAAPAVDPNAIPGFKTVQAHFVKFLQTPVVRQISDATFSQVTRTASAKSGAKEAFDPDPVNPDYEKILIEFNMQNDDVEAFANEMINFKDVNVAADGKSIRVPTVVVQGRDDQLVPAEGPTAFARSLPRGTLVLLPGGHMVTWVHPQKVAAAITRVSR